MDKFQVNHKDGNKTNNNLNNLEWCTPSQNIKHAFDHKLKTQKGEHNNNSKLNEQDVKEIIALLLTKQYTLVEIANKYNVSDSTIGSIKNKTRWKYLTENINFN